jgi:hypothetical protein
MLAELDKEGGMQRRSETVCLTGDDPSRTAAARCQYLVCSAPVTDSLGPRPGHTLKGGGHDGATIFGRSFVGFRRVRFIDGSAAHCHIGILSNLQNQDRNP